MSWMFENNDVFTGGGIGNWDVSNVKYMAGMFNSSKQFNEDIGNWNILSVVPGSNNGMSNLLYNAVKFNQDLSGWYTSNFNGVKPTNFDFNIPTSTWSQNRRPNWTNPPC